MKLRWGKRKLTFMIIPDADRSVMRFRVPNFVVFLVPLVMMMIMITTLSLYIVHLKTQQMAEKLTAELTGNAELFEQTVTTKDSTITQLQDDLLQLTQQANEIKAKVDELKELESDIKGLTFEDPLLPLKQPGENNNVVVLSSSDYGMGGSSAFPGSSAFHEKVHPDLAEVISATKSEFSSLDDEMDVLFVGLSEAKEKVIELQHIMRITPSLWPTKSWRVSSPFGYRRDPFHYRDSIHSGIDIAGNYDDPIYATADGTVQFTGWDPYHGNNIIINHSSGIRTWYMHLNESIVKQEEEVEKGQIIGLLGSTGRSTGPHLHYEVILHGESIDPSPYMTQYRKDED